MKSLRILMNSETWLGGGGYACLRALRSMGHSVQNVPETEYLAAWRSTTLRVVRRLLMPRIVKEMNRQILRVACHFQPQLFLAFKGTFIMPETLVELRNAGVTTYNYYPDVSFLAHGPWLPKALPEYDWVFTTKPYGVDDLRRHLGITQASYLPHGFDSDLHHPVELTNDEQDRYGCDVSLISNYTPKKWTYLEAIAERLPNVAMKIYGANNHLGIGTRVAAFHQQHEVFGLEYTKAIAASKICLGLMRETQLGSSDGDLTAMRTYEIPAVGTFMLHERNSEVAEMLREDVDCGMFGSTDELVDKVQYYLVHETERRRIAESGRARIRRDGHSYDDRVRHILAYFEKCRTLKSGVERPLFA